MTDIPEAIQQVLQKAWADAAFKQQLLANPREALAAMGVDLTGLEGVTLKVVENTADTVHLVLPPPPRTEGELSDEQLDGVAGGVGWDGTFSSGQRDPLSSWYL